jgi:hypothetical protein
VSPVRHRVVDVEPPATGEYKASEFILLAEQFKRVPDNMRRTLARRLRPIGERALAAARANASWSSRIPSAITLQVRFIGKAAGLALVVDHNAAPHARPYEGILSMQFRHPLFGDRDFWYEQTARPYVWPAVAATQQAVAVEVDAAIDDVLTAAGFN